MADAQGFVSVASTANTGNAVPLGSTPLNSGSTGAAAADGSVVQQVRDLFQRSSHPTAAFFHVLFKSAAIIFYFLASFFTQSFVIVFVTVVILMAFDFWTVKNVTGRLLVGLRWWNDVAEDGTSSWRYESIDDPSQVSRADYAIFWYSMYLTAILWGVLAFLALLKLNVEYLLVTVVCLVLTWSNIYGYWQCSKDARQRIQQGVQSVISQGVASALTSRWGAMGAGAAAPPRNVGGDVV